MSLSLRLLLIISILLITITAEQSQAEQKPESRISLKEAVLNAVKRNFDISLERIGTQIAEQDKIIAESEFDTSLGALVSTDASKNRATSALSDPDTNESNSVGVELSASRKTSLGGTYKLSVTADKYETNSTFQSLDPSYNTALRLEATQPLLKNAGRSGNLWRVNIGANNEAISKERLKAKISDVITETKEAYWELVFSTNNLTVAQDLLMRAKDLERKVRIQVDVGSLAPIEIVQAQASVASREVSVLTADNRLDQVADQLMRLINPGDDSPLWNMQLVPEDSPVVEPLNFDTHKAIALALENRPEILQARKEIENRNIELAYYENQNQLSLDVLATLQLNGIRGEAQPVVNLSTGEAIVSDLDGGLNDSISDSLSGSHYDYFLGLQLTHPLGNRSAKSSWAIASFNAQTAIIKLKNLEREITLQVRNAAREVENGLKQIVAAEAARDLAEQKLDAEQRKFDVGTSTAFNVLQFQIDLAVEKSNEMLAKTDYLKAVALLENAVGKALETEGITLDTKP